MIASPTHRFLKLAFYTLFCALEGIGLSPSDSMAASAEIEKPPIYLQLGEQRIVHVPGLVRFSLGEGAVRAQGLPTQKKAQKNEMKNDLILLKAIHPGPSDLWIWKTDGTAEHRVIRVDKTASNPLSPRLSRALDTLREVEIHYSTSGVILRGEIQSLEEAEKIATVAQGFPQEVHDETEPSDALLDRAQIQLENWLVKSGYARRIKVFREDKTLGLQLVQGSIGGPAERSRIEKHARAIFPLAQASLETLPDTSPTVHFKVFLLELRKNRFRSLGLGWPPYQEGAFRVTTSMIQDLIQLDLTLQILEGEGSVKVLSNPELVVRAPGDAELFSGGEIPIETKSAYFSNVTWKNFGLLLQLHVTHSAGDRVRLDITTEVSHLDSSIAIQKIPGLQANRMKTQVDAQYGRPLLLSGLLQQNIRKQVKGLPVLSSIPVLGALFGSEDYINEKSELVAILVPSKELPKNPMERITRLLPKGPLPSPREPAHPEQERAQQQSSDYPWNVLQ
jgi:Flp pilus assembly secretin CpaC